MRADTVAALRAIARQSLAREREQAQRCSCLPAIGYVCTADKHSGEFDK